MSMPLEHQERFRRGEKLIFRGGTGDREQCWMTTRQLRRAVLSGKAEGWGFAEMALEAGEPKYSVFLLCSPDCWRCRAKAQADADLDAPRLN
jgi:hypothetical protein